jgi:transposase-like protein
MAEKRKRWMGLEIMEVLRRVLVGREEISKVCEEMGCHPTQVYRWQKQLMEGGAKVFEHQEKNDQELEEAKRREGELSKKLRRKDEVLAELMEEHVRLKKKSGDISGENGLNTIFGTKSWTS